MHINIRTQLLHAYIHTYTHMPCIHTIHKHKYKCSEHNHCMHTYTHIHTCHAYIQYTNINISEKQTSCVIAWLIHNTTSNSIQPYLHIHHSIRCSHTRFSRLNNNETDSNHRLAPSKGWNMIYRSHNLLCKLQVESMPDSSKDTSLLIDLNK